MRIANYFLLKKKKYFKKSRVLFFNFICEKLVFIDKSNCFENEI